MGPEGPDLLIPGVSRKARNPGFLMGHILIFLMSATKSENFESLRWPLSLTSAGQLESVALVACAG